VGVATANHSLLSHWCPLVAPAHLCWTLRLWLICAGFRQREWTWRVPGPSNTCLSAIGPLFAWDTMRAGSVSTLFISDALSRHTVSLPLVLFVLALSIPQACLNLCLWAHEEVGPTSVVNGTSTYVLTQPLPAVGWRGAWWALAVAVVCVGYPVVPVVPPRLCLPTAPPHCPPVCPAHCMHAGPCARVRVCTCPCRRRTRPVSSCVVAPPNQPIVVPP
jgi:hypothetical protein